MKDGQIWSLKFKDGTKIGMRVNHVFPASASNSGKDEFVWMQMVKTWHSFQFLLKGETPEGDWTLIEDVP